MTLDQPTIQWLLTGFFFLSGGLINFLLSRSVGQMDKRLDDHDDRIKTNRRDIDATNLKLAEKYVSKTDLEKHVEMQIKPIREDIDEIKGDIKDMKTDLKTLLLRRQN